MTALLEFVFEKATALPDNEQDNLEKTVLETLGSNHKSEDLKDPLEKHPFFELVNQAEDLGEDFSNEDIDQILYGSIHLGILEFSLGVIEVVPFLVITEDPQKKQYGEEENCFQNLDDTEMFNRSTQ